MRRVALYGIGWLSAATVAVLLAWQGVGRVGTTVTDSHPRALSAEEVRETLAAGNNGDAAGAPTTGTETPVTTTATISRPSPLSTSSTAPSTTRSTSPAPSPTTTGSTTSGVVRTYNLVGGSATLRFEASGKVNVVWANPNPGFRADVDDRDGGGVRIRFDGDSHRSELEAWWDGQPRDEVRESGDDDNSGSGSSNSTPSS